MMKKSFYAGAMVLVAATTQAVPPLINGVSLSPYLDEWERTNDILIQKPLETAQNKRVWSKKAKVVPGVLAGAAALAMFLRGGKGWPFNQIKLGGKKKRKTNDDSRRGQPMKPMTESSYSEDNSDGILETSDYHRPYNPGLLVLQSLGIGAAIAGIGYGAMWLKNRYFGFSTLVKEEERAQLNRVLDAWSEVKTYFPKELYKMIEDLLVYRDAKVKDYNTHVDRTIATIKKAIHVHYWEKKKQRPWYE